MSKKDSVKPWCDPLQSQFLEAKDFANKDPVLVPADVPGVVHSSLQKTFTGERLYKPVAGRVARVLVKGWLSPV
jgi:hypothetical protein